MQVVATAGHEGHGKSSLVHALTGATADGLQAFQYLNIFCLITSIRLNHNSSE